MSIYLPHGFTPEYAERAVALCTEAMNAGQLCPKDAYDVVASLSSSIQSGTTIPETLGELAFVTGVLSVVPYHEGDGK